LIGEIQVTDIPGRCEPGTGEVNWPAVAQAIIDIGYTGVVGLESFASGDDVNRLGTISDGVLAIGLEASRLDAH
jgi:hydroxypyruvate isomerase